MDTFKFKITLDRHNVIQDLHYYDLPNPPRFSLPSTFKEILVFFLIFMLLGFLYACLCHFQVCSTKKYSCPYLKFKKYDISQTCTKIKWKNYIF
jgi:hypothetical protein